MQSDYRSSCSTRPNAPRFGGRVLAERELTVGSEGDLASINAFVAADAALDDSTAVWSALDHAYDLVQLGQPLVERGKPALPHPGQVGQECIKMQCLACGDVIAFVLLIGFS